MKFLIGMLVLLFAITGCGASAEESWNSKVTEAGWVLEDTAFDKAEILCDMTDYEAQGLLNMTLVKSESRDNMDRQGLNLDESVATYISATREHRC